MRPTACNRGGIDLAPRLSVALRVMTYNIQGQASRLRSDHIERVAQLISEVQPDVIGLQEVHRGGWQARGRDQATDMERLTGMQLAFGPAFSTSRSVFGNAILTTGDILQSSVHPLPGRGEPRSLLTCALDVRGVRLQACVTHLAAWGPLAARTRGRQAAEVARLVGELTGPIILTGDFNAPPGRRELAPLHEGPLMLPYFRGGEVTYARTRQCLDAILVDRGWRVAHAEVRQAGPSDHWPMIAELERA